MAGLSSPGVSYLTQPSYLMNCPMGAQSTDMGCLLYHWIDRCTMPKKLFSVAGDVGGGMAAVL